MVLSERAVMLVRIFRAKGPVYFNQARYDKALKWYLQAIELTIRVYPMNQKLMDRLNYGPILLTLFS